MGLYHRITWIYFKLTKEGNDCLLSLFFAYKVIININLNSYFSFKWQIKHFWNCMHIKHKCHAIIITWGYVEIWEAKNYFLTLRDNRNVDCILKNLIALNNIINLINLPINLPINLCTPSIARIVVKLCL